MDTLHHYMDTATIFSAISLALIAGLAIAYAGATRALRRTNRRWSGGRIAAFMTGAVLLAIAMSPPLMNLAHHDLRGHMVQHLLIGMFAPLGLVLAAPMTLTLRTLPAPAARYVTGLLNSCPLQVLSHPVTALLLNTGGMYLLYMTPLYAATLNSPALHHLVHIHFLAAGYLFTWSILAGPDTSPHSPGMWTRLSVLFISMAAHATLGKLMYGYLWPRNTPHRAEEIRTATQLMYYGGDLAEVLLAVALFGLWYQNGGSRRYSLYPVVEQ